jgi:hypothetical protein
VVCQVGVPNYFFVKAARRHVKRFFRIVKHTIVGALEALSLIVMVGASKILTPTGTYLIVVGLFIGVIGLAIHDVWRV